MRSFVVTRTSRVGIWSGIVGFALAFCVLVGWAVSSPIGSSPDDDFHLTSVWCAGAGVEERCAPAGDGATRDVPRAVAEAAHCYRWDPSLSAECQTRILESDSIVETGRGNFNPSYPPVYYSIMSVFVTSDIDAAAITMRVVNLSVFLAMFGAVFLLSASHRRRELVLTWTVTTVPLGLFLLASNNPSGWATMGVGLLWASLVGYLESSSRGHVIGFGAVAVISTVLGAGSRGDAAVYCLLAIGMACVVSARFSRPDVFRLILPVGLAVVAVLFSRSARQVASGVQGFGGGSGVVAEIAATDPLQLAVDNFLALPGLWAGVFGGDYGLGWLDTDVPAVVTFAGAVAFIGILMYGIGVSNVRKTTMMIAMAATLWLLPVWVLTRGADPVGEQVQPRYLLPLVVLMAGIVLFTPRGRRARTIPTSALISIAALLTLSHAAALFTNIRRYTTGNDVGGYNLDALIEWWWVAGPSPMTVLVGTSLAFAGLMAVIVRWLAATPRSETAVLTAQAPLRDATVAR